MRRYRSHGYLNSEPALAADPSLEHFQVVAPRLLAHWLDMTLGGCILGCVHHGLCHDLGGGIGRLVDAVRLVLCHLLLNPEVGLLETLSQVLGWSPSEQLLDLGVVGVTATNTLWARDVLNRKVLLLEAADECHHVVHGDHLVGAKVEGLLNVGCHQAEDALHTVVDEAERACLLAISPHLQLGVGCQHLAAEGSRGLFASALPGSPWPVDVVETSNAHSEAEVLRVVLADLLSIQLLQAVAVLGGGRPGILLAEASASTHVLSVLDVFRVAACARGVEEALDHAIVTSSLQHVNGDHSGVVHDARVVGLDEAHATHVSSEVEHPLATCGSLDAIFDVAKVEELELRAELLLLEVLVTLPVDGDHMVTLTQ